MTTCYVVTPTYNEYDNLGRLVEHLLSLEVENLKVLVVDDASPDGTGALADALALEHPGRVEVLHRSGKLGLGTAYCEGFALALERGADYVVQMDADLSHPPELIPSMIAALETSDVVVGSRYTRGGGLDADWAMYRKLLSWAGNNYIRRVLGLPIKDVTTGFVAFRGAALAQLNLGCIRSSGFFFLAEVKLNCHRLGFRIREVPFIFMNRTAGKSKIGPEILIEALWGVWCLRFSNRHSPEHAASSARLLGR